MSMSIRNEQFEGKKHLIEITVKSHHRLIKGANLDEEDVRQELAVRLLESLDKYDPERCVNLDAYLTLQLRYHLLHMKESSKRYGVPQAPRKDFSILSINAQNEAGLEMQVPSFDESPNIIWLENEIAGLPDSQRKAIDRLLSGKRVHCTNKALQAAREHIRCCLDNMAPMLAC